MSEARERYYNGIWDVNHIVSDYVSELEQENKELRKTLKQCMTWLQKESKSMPNYNITHSVLWQSFEEMLDTGGER